MRSFRSLALGLVASVLASPLADAQPSGALTLPKAVQRALASNPKLTAAERDIGIAAGRQIQVIVEDDEAIPAVGLTKARKLVERDKVHLMAGALLSSTGYALAPYIDSMRIPMIYPVVSADDLTQRRRSKWIV